MSPPRTMLGPVIRLLGELNGERSVFVRSTLSMTIFQLATAATIGLSTTIATSVASDGDRGLVISLILGLLAAVVIVAVFTWIESWLSHVLAYRVLAALRMRVYDAVQRIVPSRSGARRTGEIAGTAMNDVEILEWFYAHTLGAGINAVVSPLMVSIALIAVVGPIGFLVPAGILLLLTIPWLFSSRQRRQGSAIRASIGDLQAVAFEGAESRRELAALGLTAHHHAQVLERTASLQDAKRRFALRAAAESALADVIVAVTSLGFLVALLSAAARGDLDPVVIPAALVLVTAAVSPAAGAFTMLQRLGEMSAAARRVLDLIDAGVDTRSRGTALPTDGPGTLGLSSVHFAYDDGPPVLTGLDMTISAGETLALVGASGAGKTTIARLLTGLWRPNHGHILLDGVDIDGMDETALRREIALVSQHPFVFRGTVRENLLLAAPDADEEHLWRALSDAGLAATIAGWENGLDTRVGDRGATLSGGQRQRLSIAQVMLRDPTVLVLDEASAQLDALHEADLADTVERLRASRTTIVIAHRVSTIRRAERIIVIDGGQVIADGTHTALLEENAHYRALLAHTEPSLVPPSALVADTASEEGRR